jgi:putative Holliday junction resolvase
MTGRVVAFDLGDRRIGVAVSDETGVLASGRETIARHGESYPWRAILAVVEEAEAVAIVVGDPLHMDGEAGERSRLARAFADEIARRTGLPVELEDERLTSEEAGEILARRGRAAGARERGDVDRVAAMLILQGWLDDRAREDRT